MIMSAQINARITVLGFVTKILTRVAVQKIKAEMQVIYNVIYTLFTFIYPINY